PHHAVGRDRGSAPERGRRRARARREARAASSPLRLAARFARLPLTARTDPSTFFASTPACRLTRTPPGCFLSPLSREPAGPPRTILRGRRARRSAPCLPPRRPAPARGRATHVGSRRRPTHRERGKVQRATESDQPPPQRLSSSLHPEAPQRRPRAAHPGARAGARAFVIGDRAREFWRRFFPEAGAEHWNDWTWQLRHRFRDLAGLERIVRLSDSERKTIERIGGRLPVGITPFYASLMD